MKIIIVRDAQTKTVINTYMVNDDVILAVDTEERLRQAGYTHTVLHPIPMNQKNMDDEIDDYCSPDMAIT